MISLRYGRGMGGSQGSVPLWVPILVGILGMLGVILGQIINAWRESKRATREELYKRIAHWRDQRLEFYSEVIEATHKAVDKVAAASLTNTEKERTRLLTEAVEDREKIDHLRAKMILIGTQRVYYAYDSARKDILEGISVVTDTLRDPSKDKSPAGNEIDFSATIQDLYKSVNELARTMRDDLGVHA